MELDTIINEAVGYSKANAPVTDENLFLEDVQKKMVLSANFQQRKRNQNIITGTMSVTFCIVALNLVSVFTIPDFNNIKSADEVSLYSMDHYLQTIISE